MAPNILFLVCTSAVIVRLVLPNCPLSTETEYIQNLNPKRLVLLLNSKWPIDIFHCLSLASLFLSHFTSNVAANFAGFCFLISFWLWPVLITLPDNILVQCSITSFFDYCTVLSVGLPDFCLISCSLFFNKAAIMILQHKADDVRPYKCFPSHQSKS